MEIAISLAWWLYNESWVHITMTDLNSAVIIDITFDYIYGIWVKGSCREFPHRVYHDVIWSIVEISMAVSKPCTVRFGDRPVLICLDLRIKHHVYGTPQIAVVLCLSQRILGSQLTQWPLKAMEGLKGYAVALLLHLTPTCGKALHQQVGLLSSPADCRVKLATHHRSSLYHPAIWVESLRRRAGLGRCLQQYPEMLPINTNQLEIKYPKIYWILCLITTYSH